MPVERMHLIIHKATPVEFENPDEAEKALKHMDGGVQPCSDWSQTSCPPYLV